MRIDPDDLDNYDQDKLRAHYTAMTERNRENGTGMTKLERALYDALRNTPASTAHEERLTAGDVVSVAALEECAENIASTRNMDDASLWINDLGLQQKVYESACERVAEVLEDFSSPEETGGGMERGELSAQLASFQALK